MDRNRAKIGVICGAEKADGMFSGADCLSLGLSKRCWRSCWRNQQIIRKSYDHPATVTRCHRNGRAIRSRSLMDNPIALFLAQSDGVLDSFADIVYFAIFLLGLSINYHGGDVRRCFHWFPGVVCGLTAWHMRMSGW